MVRLARRLVLTLALWAAVSPLLPAVRAAGPLPADTPMTTKQGNTFIAPVGWTVSVRGAATIVEAPEGDSRIVLVDVTANDADAALAAGWAAYKAPTWTMKLSTAAPDQDGWSRQRSYEYEVSPNEKRAVSAVVQFAGGVWTVAIYDMSQAVGEKRAAQVNLILGKLLPKGYTRESFAGRKANTLDKARVAELSRFVERGMKATGVPGVALGIVQGGATVFAGGFGVRELGGTAKPDADTLFMIASNTKALTTLLLAKLVDQGKIGWKTPVTSLLPSFKLGGAETTSRVLVENLICACTGLPRQDMEWLFQYGGVTPEMALATLATMQPTSKFGEMFQYSNPLAGAAGLVAGHVAYPEMELGAAYDKAIQVQVFDPLGMKATTFDYAKALAGNHAGSHAPNVDGKMARAAMEVNYSIIPLRPAGAAWSNVNDMLKYVSMELSEGLLPDGTRFISKGPLLERRAPKVPIGDKATYGMGLMVDATYGVTVVHHGGDLIGYHSDMIWLPDQKVGAVILTNGDLGWLIRGGFRRKLLEVLFDGKPEADTELASAARSFFDSLAADRKQLVFPPDPKDAGALASRYANDALGEIAVRREKGATVFDFGEWKSPVASRHNPDGTVSFLTLSPGVDGIEFVVGSAAKKTLVLRDPQHEYVFEER